MDYITTTNLRTQSSELISTLKKGGTVSLIHRSQIVGIIKPKKEPKVLAKADIKELKQLAKSQNVAKMSYKKRNDTYREHLMNKYGKDIS